MCVCACVCVRVLGGSSEWERRELANGRRVPSRPTHSFPGAAVTKCHRLGFNSRNVSSHDSGEQQPESKASAGSVPSAVCLLIVICPLCVPMSQIPHLYSASHMGIGGHPNDLVLTE